MSLRIACFALSLSLGSPAMAAVEDFDCSGARKLVRLMVRGPDAVYEHLHENGEDFVMSTIDGWRCFPEPLEMQEGNRIVVRELECFYTTESTRVSEEDLVRAGEIFQSNVSTMLNCFDGESINQTPKTYSGQVRGEALLFHVDRDVDVSLRAKVLLEYGYYRPEPGAPLYWEVTAGYSIHEDDSRATPVDLSFDSWEYEGGGGASFSLYIDGEYAGRLDNTDGDDVLDVDELTPGSHSFEMKRIRLYDPWGRQIDSGGWCRGSFERMSDEEDLWLTLRALPGGYRCFIE